MCYNVWLHQTQNTVRHASGCGVNFSFVVADGVNAFPWASHLETLFTETSAHVVCAFSNGVTLSLFVLCQVCGLHIFSPALQMVFSSRSRVFCWTIIFLNLQRSRVYQGSVCRWCFWCQLLRISFPSHKFPRIFKIFLKTFMVFALYI